MKLKYNLKPLLKPDLELNQIFWLKLKIALFIELIPQSYLS